MDIAVLLTDEHGVVRETNEASRRMTGSTEGRPCHQVFRYRDHATRCSEGCVAAMLAGEVDHVSQHVTVRAGRVLLACHPVRHAVMIVAYGPTPADQALTPREVEVLALVADGLTGPQIAERTGLSRSTVNTHVEHAREKLGARTRTEAVAVAVRRGLLGPR
ncbi:MAG: response regulator transcription factor [Myxococcales bacterium]|nr:response regulator transcription factor [Myxococcales bacterium]